MSNARLSPYAATLAMRPWKFSLLACLAGVLGAAGSGCAGNHVVLAEFPNESTSASGQEVLWIDRDGVLMRCYADEGPICVRAEYRSRLEHLRIRTAPSR
jgi:hypothetical protein